MSVTSGVVSRIEVRKGRRPRPPRLPAAGAGRTRASSCRVLSLQHACGSLQNVAFRVWFQPHNDPCAAASPRAALRLRQVTGYAHGAAELLGIQVDAAINSGNSGGPAFNDRGACGDQPRRRRAADQPVADARQSSHGSSACSANRTPAVVSPCGGRQADGVVRPGRGAASHCSLVCLTHEWRSAIPRVHVQASAWGLPSSR
jgi:hypothetical protein